MNATIETSRAFVATFDLPPHQPGPLSGLTFAVKDLIDVAGYKTGCGNPSWSETHPIASAHAICVEQLLYAGARCVGKTVTDELAFSLIGENAHYGTPLNPRAPDRVPGGSSSGSASAVACGLVDFALGTDTGGSVRVPASNCGLYGFRPSWGRISVAGVNPFAPSFDTVGVLARDAAVLSKVAEVLLGTQLKRSTAPRSIFLLEDAFEISDPDVSATLMRAIVMDSRLKQFPTISIKELVDDSFDLAGLVKIYRTLQWAEVWSTLGPWIESMAPNFGPHIAKNFALARECNRQDLPQAIELRDLFRSALNDFLGYGLLCMPTTATLAPKKGSVGVDRTVGTYFPRVLGMTSLAGLAGLPEITLPLGVVDEVPIGLSLLAAAGDDELLLQALPHI